MKKLSALLILAVLLAPSYGLADRNWVVYYSDKIPAEAFKGFDLVVFDHQHHPDLAPLKDKTLLGYISLGEAEDYRNYFNDIKKLDVFITDNHLWPGHIIVDIRKPAWKEYVLNTLIPMTLEHGFDGVMFDTIDSPIYLEKEDPKKYPGMHEAAVDLLRAVRARFPGIKIMVNRGFEIMPEVAGDVDMVMAETIYTDWQPGTKNPVIQPKEQTDRYLDMIAKSQAASSKLRIYSIDYWPAEDREQVQAIYNRQRVHGFVPYVAPSLELDKIGEPL